MRADLILLTTRQEFNLSHGSDRGQGFTTEAHRTEGEEIIGFAQIDGAEFSSVSIKLTHQGKGLGKEFTKFLVNRILEQGDETPYLYCIVGNDKAHKLYESLGFQEVSCNAYAEKMI